MTVCFESSTPQNQDGKKYAEIQFVNVLLFVFYCKVFFDLVSTDLNDN
jgi:hypothetical protein